MTELLEKAIALVKQLPESEQDEFAEIILKKFESKKVKAFSSYFSLKNQPFVGMWKDRKEMQNSSEWVRQLRRKQWQD